MAWWMAAAALAPTIIGALTPKPSMPNTTVSMPVMPDRSKYMNQMLDTGFNPNSEIYQLASAQLGDQVRQQLAMLNLNNSSYGLNMMSGSQSDLARKFIEDAAQRQRNALQLALGYDTDVANMQMGINRDNANAAMQRYQMEDQNKRELIGGIGTAIGTGMQYYQNDQMQRQIKDQTAQNQRNFEMVYGPRATMGAKVGVPYSPPVYSGSPMAPYTPMRK